MKKSIKLYNCINYNTRYGCGGESLCTILLRFGKKTLQKIVLVLEKQDRRISSVYSCAPYYSVLNDNFDYDSSG